MSRLLFKCMECRIYTLKAKCPKCGSVTMSPHPPRFSPEDRYLRYRMRERYEEEEKTAAATAQVVSGEPKKGQE